MNSLKRTTAPVLAGTEGRQVLSGSIDVSNSSASGPFVKRTSFVGPIDAHQCDCGAFCHASAGGLCASDREEVLR